MVCKRKLDFRPSSIGFPVIPRGPRSVRRKISRKDDIEDKEISAFELLAAVAGKILEEGESSASSNSKTIPRKLIPNESDNVLETGSIVSAFNTNNHDEKEMLEFPDKKLCVKEEDGSPNYGESSDGYVDNSNERDLEAKERKLDHFVDFIGTNISKDKLKINVNYYPLINPGGTVQLTSFGDCVPNDSFLRCKNNVNISSRDDDENFIRCNQRKPKIRAFRPRSCIGYRRIRKLSTSKYWKVAPKLKDSEFSNSERGMKRIFYNRKYCHNSQRFQQEGPFKKRKLFDGSPRHASDREGSSESISNTPEKGVIGEKSGAFKSRKERGMSSPFVGQCPSYQSMDSHVKFSIKSFKVPELYIEVPETATVGSLKRTVMEAVTAILEEGLRVGVLLQGEKVKDDERTLLQSGISQNGNLDKLGFSLEPISTVAPSPVSPEVTITLPSCETPQQLTRFVASPLLESGITSTSADPLQVVNMDTDVISNHELVPFTTDTVTKNETPDSVVLVPLPTPNVVEELPVVPLPTPSVVEELPVVLVPLSTPSVVEELSVVPMAQKAKRTDLAQRRTRRPFSVTEVEALVEAVETLGTGRWRDVKLRAFEAADHRTYVDLKDKWKTLVHTASISPQQRRGQPVPQVLLDRVLGAHAYWSQHQSKQQHDKNQAELGTLKVTTPNVCSVKSCDMNKQ